MYFLTLENGIRLMITLSGELDGYPLLRLGVNKCIAVHRGCDQHWIPISILELLVRCAAYKTKTDSDTIAH
jgi:hypothetical protein